MDLLLEITKILNDPGINWKVRRALLRHKCELPEPEIKKLVPEEDE